MPDNSAPLLNLHHASEIADLASRLTSDEPSEVIVVSGERASGRKFLLSAAADEARRQGYDVWFSSIDLDGYEPGAESLEPYVRFQLSKGARALGADADESVSRIAASPGPDQLSRVLAAALILGRDSASDGLVEPLLTGGVATCLADQPDARRLALHVADVAELSVVLRERIFAWAEAETRLRPALSCLPTDGRGVVGPGRELARFEIQPLDPGELPALCEAGGGPELTVDQARSLEEAAGGLAGVAARLLASDRSWRDPLQTLEAAPDAERDRIRTFLHLAALCGDNIPVRTLAAFLGADGEEEQEDFIDAVDDSVGAESERPLLAERFQHPSFPGETVYGFADPLTSAVLRQRLPVDSRRRLAGELLGQALKAAPPLSRAAVRLALELAVQAESPAYRRELRRQLACWVGEEEAVELTAILEHEVRAEFRGAPEIWSTVNNVQFHWPPWRTLAALDGVRPEALHPRLRASRSAVRAGLLLELGHHEEALAEAQAGLSQAGDPLLEAALQNRIAAALQRLGRVEEAAEARRLGQEICERLLEEGDARVAPWMRDRVEALRRAGREDEAERLKAKLQRIPAEN